MTGQANEPKYVAETLAWCNARRAERKKKPLAKLPKGHRNDATSCPCGRATGLVVYDDAAYEDNEMDTRVPVNRSVSRFVLAFDRGRLPQYEAKS